MKTLGEVIKDLRGKASLREAAKKIGISHTYLDTVEKGFDKRSGSPIKPTPETLRLISAAYNYPYKELMKLAGYIEDSSNKPVDSNLPGLDEGDERDIARKLESILGELDSDTGLAFDGEPMDETTRELVRAQIESNLRFAKQMSKRKSASKSYRKNDGE